MRIFIAILLSSFLLTSVASAKGKMIFDLKKQYYSGTLIKKGEEGYNDENKYDVGDVIVTTDTVFYPPAYIYGIFTVDIKEPLQNWNVNIKKKNGTRQGMTTIRLTSDKGESYFITYNSYNGNKVKIGNSTEYAGTIQVNDKIFPKILRSKIMNQKISAIISNKNGVAKFKINGKTFLKTDDKKFGKLSKVEVELNDNEYDDELLALDISRVD